MTELVRAQAWRGFHETVSAFGGDAEAILSEAGVDAAAISDADSYASYADLMRTFEIAAARLNRSDFGLRLGRNHGIGVMGALSIAAQNCATAREGLECAARHARFHNPSLRIGVEQLTGATCDLVWVDLSIEHASLNVQNSERMISFLHNALAHMAGPGYAPVEVWFRHARVAPIEAYRDVFGCVPRFGQRRNGVVATRAVLDAPQQGRSEHLRRLALQHMQSLGLGEGAALGMRVRGMLLAMMPSGGGSQADIARALAMHERTLQRRLKQDGRTFDEIKDAVRRELATRYLARRNLPLSQVSDLLGYAEPSALSRSCRRWFGESPRDMRRRLAA